MILSLIVSAILTVSPSWTEPDWTRFLTALRLTETGDQPNNGIGAKGDGGKSIGPYQISKACWTDATEYDKTIGGKYEDCLTDPEYSKKIVRAYVCRWLRKDGSMEDAARLWNAGPKWASKKPLTDGYAKRFQRNLDKQK